MLLHAYGMGGTIRTVVNQANAMTALGHEVEIVSVVRRRKKPQFHIDPRVRIVTLTDQRDGVRADTVGRRAWRRLRGKIVPRGEFAANYFTERVEKGVIDYVTGLQDGILVTTRPALNLISARRTPKSVVRVAQEHMNLATHPAAVRKEIIRHYGSFDTVVTLTPTDRAGYQEVLRGTPVVCIPNAVHTVDRKLSVQDSKIVVAAGRLVRQKGFDMLIKAFEQVVREHPDWRLQIYGTGPKKDALAARITEHRLDEHVRLMGRSEQLHEDLAQSAMYVLSSRFEGLPMVMIEAMSHALPIVAFDCPTGPRDVLTDEVDGLLVPPRDTDAIAEAMNRLIKDRDLRVRLGAAAVRTAERFDPEAVMPLWDKLFTDLMAR
jgi:glycosyltransferase involved in cell wall biosynthesis